MYRRKGPLSLTLSTAVVFKAEFKYSSYTKKRSVQVVHHAFSMHFQTLKVKCRHAEVCSGRAQISPVEIVQQLARGLSPVV